MIHSRNFNLRTWKKTTAPPCPLSAPYGREDYAGLPQEREGCICDLKLEASDQVVIGYLARVTCALMSGPIREAAGTVAGLAARLCPRPRHGHRPRSCRPSEPDRPSGSPPRSPGRTSRTRHCHWSRNRVQVVIQFLRTVKKQRASREGDRSGRSPGLP